MMNTHPVADSTHTGQTSGTRNGRGRSGSVYRSTSTPVLTRTNAKSVPMFVKSYVSAASPINAQAATNTPVMIVVVEGTLVFGWIVAAHRGSRPSRAMAKKIRGCPY